MESTVEATGTDNVEERGVWNLTVSCIITWLKITGVSDCWQELRQTTKATTPSFTLCMYVK